VNHLPFFLLFGQSNMVGRGDISELNNEDFDLEDIFIWKNKEWSEASYHDDPDPNDTYFVKADLKKGVGPGFFFAKNIVKNFKSPVGLLQCAKGGTGINKWSYHSDLRKEMFSRLGSALLKGRLMGCLIYIGEGDTHSFELADNWESTFKELINEIIDFAEDKEIPFIFAQLSNIEESRKSKKKHAYKAWDYLKAIQKNIFIKNTSIVYTDDLELKDDGLHLKTKSQKELAKRFYEAYKSSLFYKKVLLSNHR